ncbi:MAG: ATP synthase F1 subunit epsilon [Alphaproteobacteria bacterium]|jgi:F-type H+-transporting ATPase subunit epsilon|nr:ATP synthase F1 subunit epsilon [Alphaproteobacteria bacterium]
MAKIHFDLVSPEKSLFSDDVDMVVIPGKDGYFGVLHEHTPFVTSLKPGLIGIYKDGKRKERLYVKSGFADVTPNQCTVLAEEVVVLSTLDLEKLNKNLIEMESDKEESLTPQAQNLREMLDAIKDADFLYPMEMH